MSSRRTRLTRAGYLGLGLLVALVAAWFARRPILIAAGSVLVEEDALAPAQIMVVSHSMSHATTLEAALLYERHISDHIVMTDVVQDPLADNIRKLGIPIYGAIAMSKSILERSNVPRSALTILPDRTDGTGAEVTAIAAFATRCQLTSILVITARTHTARTKWLLQRRLPATVQVSVRSPRFDRFAVDGWWRERDQSRDMAIEYLRWFNTALLRDLWRRRSPSVEHQAVVPACTELSTPSTYGHAGL